MGCFAYSPVDGASANALPDPVPEEVKEERRERFMRLQAKISRDRLLAKVGRKMIVLVDEVHDHQIIARGPSDAPEIDGQVLISGDWELDPGDFVQVEITGAGAHDLYAEPVVRSLYSEMGGGGKSLAGRALAWYLDRHVSGLFRGDSKRRPDHGFCIK